MALKDCTYMVEATYDEWQKIQMNCGWVKDFNKNPAWRRGKFCQALRTWLVFFGSSWILFRSLTGLGGGFLHRLTKSKFN